MAFGVFLSILKIKGAMKLLEKLILIPTAILTLACFLWLGTVCFTPIFGTIRSLFEGDLYLVMGLLFLAICSLSHMLICVREHNSGGRRGPCS